MKDYEEIVKHKLETISEDVFNLLHLKGEDSNRLFELIHHINVISDGTDRKYEDKEFLDLFLKKRCFTNLQASFSMIDAVYIM
mgnify:CR=1 FL=1